MRQILPTATAANNATNENSQPTHTAMKTTQPYRKVLRQVLIIALAGASTLAVVAQPRQPDGGRSDARGPGPAPQQPAKKSPAKARPAMPPAPTPRGYVEVRHGKDVFFTHRGVFYRSGPRGYVVVRPPAGIRVPVLPFGYARIIVGNAVFFRYNNIYYQPVPGGYVVVNTPVTRTVVVTTAPAPVPVQSTTVITTPATNAPVVSEADTANISDNNYQSVWVGNAEYKFKDGQFFQKTADGLIWTQAPLGAIARTLPGDATSVWYQDVEYFDCDSVYFRKTPDGYMVVEAPWKQES